MVRLALLLVLTLGLIEIGQSMAADEIGDGDIPEGFVLKEVSLGDSTMQYLERNATDEELAKIEPAAGPASEEVKPLVGPKRQQLSPEVWATRDTE